MNASNKQYCHQCGVYTATVYHETKGGHIMNQCAECKTARKGRPFISKRKYEIIKNNLSKSVRTTEGLKTDEAILRYN